MAKLILLLLNTMSILTSVACTFIAMCVLVQGGIGVLFATPFLLIAGMVEMVRCEGSEFDV